MQCLTKKVIIISDTHGFIHPAIVKLVPQCDVLIHAGDIVEQQTLEGLGFSGEVIVVAGNNDSHLPHLKNIATLDLFSQQLVVEHGHRHGFYQPCHHALRKSHPQAKIIIYGHTHKQIIDKSQTPWVINPGAAGKTRTNGGASCVLLTASPQVADWQIECLCFAD